jgi:ABC-type multidrug transport system fused ATPase/permease subunit
MKRSLLSAFVLLTAKLSAITASSLVQQTHSSPPSAPVRSVWNESLRLAGYLRDYAWAVPVMLALGLFAAFADTLGVSLAVMFLFSILGQTDDLVAGGGLMARAFTAFNDIFGAAPGLIAGVFLALILFNALLLYIYQSLTAVFMNRIAERMRDLVHARYVLVGYRYIQERERGELIHTLGTETWIVADALFSIARIIIIMCAVTVIGAGLFALSWQIGLTALACAVVTFAVLRLLSQPLRRYGAATLAENQILAERMLVSLQGMRTLRAFAQEPFVLRVFGAASSKVRALAIRAERLKALIGPVGEIASLASLVLIALIAGRAHIDVPTTVAAVLLLLRLQPQLRELDGHRLALAGMGATLANLRATLDVDDKPWPTPGDRTFDGLRDVIAFEDVSFWHDRRRDPSLDRASFAIRRGETTILSGPSGSGKTTIINLILRLYEPDAGRITVDGTDLLSLTRASWLDRIAIAGQDVELIEGTVAQNLRLAKHDASYAEIEAACAAVEILADIKAIPEGFDARIGPGGLSFSGGQRQRLGLARALIRQPDILILDEALSALEPALEDRIRARIATAMAGKTILIVSHRQGAAATGDRVIRIDHGKVVDAPSN